MENDDGGGVDPAQSQTSKGSNQGVVPEALSQKAPEAVHHSKTAEPPAKRAKTEQSGDGTSSCRVLSVGHGGSLIVAMFRYANLRQVCLCPWHVSLSLVPTHASKQCRESRVMIGRLCADRGEKAPSSASGAGGVLSGV